MLIGINLLREGLDLPEVSLCAILDADKIGFLRSATSLIQTIGRVARNADGRVIMYADRISDAMAEAISETEHRRAVQSAYNEEHGITPKTVKKAIEDIIERDTGEKEEVAKEDIRIRKAGYNLLLEKDRKKYVRDLEKQMLEYAKNLEFEKAAAVRDEIAKYKSGGVYGEEFPDRWLPAALAIVDEAFTEQNGLVNSTMKIVRGKVEKAYEDRMEFAYTPEGKNIVNSRNLSSL